MINSDWLLLGWLLHKLKREFSDTKFEIRNRVSSRKFSLGGKLIG